MVCGTEGRVRVSTLKSGSFKNPYYRPPLQKKMNKYNINKISTSFCKLLVLDNIVYRLDDLAV